MDNTIRNTQNLFIDNVNMVIKKYSPSQLTAQLDMNTAHLVKDQPNADEALKSVSKTIKNK
jgi:hypothetical protein